MTGENSTRITESVLADSVPSLQPFGFAGGLRDPDTGLIRFGARDYEPQIGSWTNKDPMRSGAGSICMSTSPGTR